jgi:predicted phage tail protein
MIAEATIWTGAIAIIAAAWCWDYRAGMLFLGVWLILAGVGQVIGSKPNAK